MSKIPKSFTYDWLLNKHYAKRIPSIIFAFGLFINHILEGVCTFGMPPSPTLATSICGRKYKNIVLELNRLVINDNLPKNILSRFVSICLNLLPKPKIIVSFADSNMNHCGYIYQATNFIYTGISSNNEGLIDGDGKEFHFRKLGHLRKNMDISRIEEKHLIKERTNLNKINVLEVCNYLKKYKEKSNLTVNQIDKLMNYKYAAGHWFRTDAGKSLPTVDDWWKLKKILKFDDKFDRLLTQCKLVYNRQEHIRQLNLSSIKIKGKHRYIFFLASPEFKKELMLNLKYKFLDYPKEINQRYSSNYKISSQQYLFI